MFTASEKTTILKIKADVVDKYRLTGTAIASVMDRMVYTGGMFASLLHKEEPRDIDIYVLNSDAEDIKILTKYFLARQNSYRNSYITETFENKKIDKKYQNSPTNPFITEVHEHDLLTFDYVGGTHKKVKYNVIYTSYESPENIVADFDFIHTTMYLYHNIFTLTEEAFRAAQRKKLILNKSGPDAARVKKFLDRGWVAA